MKPSSSLCGDSNGECSFSGPLPPAIDAAIDASSSGVGFLPVAFLFWFVESPKGNPGSEVSATDDDMRGAD
jgi:hypothetical protein